MNDTTRCESPTPTSAMPNGRDTGFPIRLLTSPDKAPTPTRSRPASQDQDALDTKSTAPEFLFDGWQLSASFDGGQPLAVQQQAALIAKPVLKRHEYQQDRDQQDERHRRHLDTPRCCLYPSGRGMVAPIACNL